MLSSLATALILTVDAGGPPEVAPHFPTTMHAVVWRNWPLVPTAILAKTLKTTPERILETGRSMGLADPPAIDEDRRRRSYITLIRRNWHLLPNDQIRELLGWDEEKFDFVYREDDFLYVKLGPKPNCPPVVWKERTEATKAAVERIRKSVRSAFPDGGVEGPAKPFDFVRKLSEAPQPAPRPKREIPWSPRFCYSYFALYGDPLLEEDLDPYPDGYLARLATSGVNGVWLQGVLSKLAPFPWDAKQSRDHERRLANLQKLCERAKKHGIGVYLYLNEPRTQPLAFFKDRPNLKGVTQGTHATLCTSQPEVRRWLAESVANICRKAPDVAGFFTITASENLTNCWSHHKGNECPRCKSRQPAEVFAEVVAEFDHGIKAAGGKQKLIALDWGWKDQDALATIARLPKSAILQSVSEWDMPITRGGVKSVVGEYSLSEVGPGPRATRHWNAAKEAGLQISAKTQANCTWELSSVPWVPCVEQTAQHAVNLRKVGINAIQLGWTLGGHPSPNLDVVAEIASDPNVTADEAMLRVAERTFGKEAASSVVQAWKECSKGMREFPYHIGTVYSGPQQMGPANLLYLKPTGRKATMVCYPWDDLDSWRQVYPPEVFRDQLEKVYVGFDVAAARIAGFHTWLVNTGVKVPGSTHRRINDEWRMAMTASRHYWSAAAQTAFIMERDQFLALGDKNNAQHREMLKLALEAECRIAKDVFGLQQEDSRIGFEATNQYYYLPIDLMEKVVNCDHLLRELKK
jgi:hypothetical protein